MKAQPQGRRWLALLLTIVLCPPHAFSANAMGNPNERYLFDIAQGVAAWRLNDFGTQSGMQLLFNFEDMKGVTVSAVHGEYKPFDALEKMIAGTDIRYEFVNRRTVTLTRVRPGIPPRKILQEKVDASRPGPGDRRSSAGGLEEVTISGRQPSSLATVGSSVISVSRTEIDATGFVTAPGVIRTLPQVFGGGPSEDTVLDNEARSNVSRGTGINLRGLSAGSTLVLMNGRRLPGAGNEGLFVDVSNLPLVAVERIDILPNSSSTYYGSDAVGGVANFVMRDRFDGFQTEAYFGDTTRGDDLDESYLSQLVGLETASGRGLLALEFYSRGNLLASSREMARSDLSEYGGDDFDSSQSNPGNIVLGSTTWAVPRGQDGTNLKPGDFSKDTPNQQDRFKGADILPEQQRVTGFGTWRHDLTDNLALFADVLVGQRDVRGAGTGASASFVVPVTNAFYVSPVPLPARVPLPMRYNYYDDLGPVISDARVKSTNLTSGFERQFGMDWHVTATAAYAEEHTSSLVTNVVNGAAQAKALASADRNTALNPFGDGSHTNRATLESLRGFIQTGLDSNVTSASVLASGTLWELPGGNLNLAFGGDAREQHFHAMLETDTSIVPTSIRNDRKRAIRSAFAEITVPIVGLSNRFRGVESLDLSFAERYEHYSDFGEEVTPRVGLSWVPLGGLTVRGSYSASFHPPGLLDLDESSNAWVIQTLRDPQAPGGTSQVLVWAGRNRDLRAESARSWTAGIELEPEQYPGTALALTYFNTDFTDRLSTPTPSADLLSNPTLASLITRAPSPEYRAEVCSRAPVAAVAGVDCLNAPIAAIADVRRRNDAIVRTHGIDMLTRYEMPSTLGKFSFSLNGTYILRFSEAKAASLPLVERVSTQTYPVNLKIRGSTRWERGPFDISVFANFLNNYRDIASDPQRRVSSWTTFDLHASYTFRSAGGWLGETTFALGADNLFDEDPPFLNNSAASLGYDQENGDLMGRVVNFTVRKKW